MASDSPKIALNLDTLEREGTRPEPFLVALGEGSPLRFADPQDIEWKALTKGQIEADQGNYQPLLRAALDPEDRARFLAASIPGWKIGKLLRAWQAHYGITAGEASASSAS